jgi:putative addiction module CopG family antidote
MQLALSPEIRHFIQKQVKSGKYATPEAVVTAALHLLENGDQGGDFKPGEWDRLLEEGEKSGKSLAGRTVLTELRRLRRRRSPRG